MQLRMFIFLAMMLAIVAGTHVYLYRRLVHDVTESRRWRRAGKALFALLAVGLIAGVVGARFLPRGLGVSAGYLAFGWMGLVMLMVPVFWGVDVVRSLRRLARALRLQPRAVNADPARRAFFARGAAAVTVLGAGSAAAMAVDEALSDPVLREVDVPIAGLPEALHGFRIAQLSDIHVGATIGAPLVSQLVARVNALDADLVAITGDLVDGTVARLGSVVGLLEGLESRHGTFFCTGNHEYYSGADAWIAELRRLGITVLRNERVTLDHDGAALDLLGVDDLRAKGFGGDHGHDLPKAAAGRDASRPAVLLAHQPKSVIEAASHHIDLVLSGHTHGGQIWPASMLVHLVQPYVKGLHRHSDRTWIYVHSGSGYWGPPMRLRIPSEIAVVRLVPA